MTRVRLVQVLAAAMLAAACGEDGEGGATGPDTQASVRFVNATTGSGGFTANGQFAAGSALAAGQAAQSCAKVAPGTTIFGFGAASAGGSALSGNPVVSSNEESIVAGGRYTVLATGSAASPTLFVFANTLSSELAANQAGIRFANFAPNTGTTVNNYVFYQGAIGGNSPLALNMPFGAVSTFTLVPSGATTFSVLQVPGHTPVIESSPATLQGGSVNTMALIRNASGGVQLLHLPRCP